MTANYHTHTTRCGHAFGSEEEYIQKAINEGLEILGFSDHTPYTFAGSYKSSVKMDISEIGEYFETLLSLREKYKDYIDIRIGFETEYYPLLWDRLIEEYKKYPLDYIILANHCVGNESISCYNSFSATTDENILRAYVDQSIAAINTGRFTYIAHPDVIHFVGDGDIYVKEMSRLISEANRLSIPLEINLCGIRYHRYYPNDIFWKTAADLGATAVFGCDAHSPEQVADKNELRLAEEYADRFGLHVLDKLTLKNPIF